MVSPFNNLQVGSRLQTFTTPSAMTQNQQTGEFFLFTLLFFIIPGILKIFIIIILGAKYYFPEIPNPHPHYVLSSYYSIRSSIFL